MPNAQFVRSGAEPNEARGSCSIPRLKKPPTTRPSRTSARSTRSLETRLAPRTTSVHRWATAMRGRWRSSLVSRANAFHRTPTLLLAPPRWQSNDCAWPMPPCPSLVPIARAHVRVVTCLLPRAYCRVPVAACLLPRACRTGSAGDLQPAPSNADVATALERRFGRGCTVATGRAATGPSNERPPREDTRETSGWGGRLRTCDRAVNSRLLYRLSYTPLPYLSIDRYALAS